MDSGVKPGFKTLRPQRSQKMERYQAMSTPTSRHVTGKISGSTLLPVGQLPACLRTVLWCLNLFMGNGSFFNVSIPKKPPRGALFIRFWTKRGHSALSTSPMSLPISFIHSFLNQGDPLCELGSTLSDLDWECQCTSESELQGGRIEPILTNWVKFGPPINGQK